MDERDARPGVLDPEAAPRQDLPVDLGVEVGEAVGELELLPVEGGSLLARAREVRVDERNQRTRLERGSGAAVDAARRLTGRNQESMSKKWTPMLVVMPPDLLRPALPGHVVPAPARGDIGEVDGVDPAGRLGGDPLAERNDGRVHPELQDVEDPPSGLPLQLRQGVQVPGIQHQRLLADRVGPDPEREADVRVVQVVWRADRHAVDALGLPLAPLLLHEPVEALELLEVAHVVEVAVEDAHRVVRVERRNEAIPGVPDRLQVPRGDEPPDSGDGEVPQAPFLSVRADDAPMATENRFAQRPAQTARQ